MVEWITSLLLIIFGAAIGAIATYCASYRIEKRKWEMNAALRRRDEIYSPIYDELASILKSLSSLNRHILASIRPQFIEWEKRRDRSVALMVPEPIRHQLDSFLSLCKDYSHAHSVLYDRLGETFSERHFGQSDQGIASLLVDKMLVVKDQDDRIVLDYLETQGQRDPGLREHWTIERLCSVKSFIINLGEWRAVEELHQQYLSSLAALHAEIRSRIQRIEHRYQQSHPDL
jgi:hypothetical protein